MNLFLTKIMTISPALLPPGADPTQEGWMKQVIDAIKQVLWIVLAVVAAAGAVYAVFLGIKMAKADSADKRKESQQHLTNVIIAVVVVIALIVFFNTVMGNIIVSLMQQSNG